MIGPFAAKIMYHAGEYLRGLGDPIPQLPPAPTLVLINSRSGGHAGPALTRALRRAVGQPQVCFSWLAAAFLLITMHCAQRELRCTVSVLPPMPALVLIHSVSGSHAEACLCGY